MAIATHDINIPQILRTTIHKDQADPTRDVELKEIYNSSNLSEASRVFYAEYMAAIIALEGLLKGSHIRYHTDENAVYNTFLKITNSTACPLPAQIGNHEKVERILIDLLTKAVNRHARIEVQLATDKPDRALDMGQDAETNYYMTVANNVAAKASGSKNIKTLPTPPPQKSSAPF